jgi:hypothetical protein
MEQIVFPIPEVCEYLTHETKLRVFATVERDDQGSKVSEFFQLADDMFQEMQWQKSLRGFFFLFLRLLFATLQLKSYLLFRSKAVVLGEQSHFHVELVTVQRCGDYQLDRGLLLPVWFGNTRSRIPHITAYLVIDSRSRSGRFRSQRSTES